MNHFLRQIMPTKRARPGHQDILNMACGPTSYPYTPYSLQSKDKTIIDLVLALRKREK